MNPDILYKSKANLMILLLIILTVDARPKINNDRLMKDLIRPLPCYDNVTEKSGICMFAQTCLEAEGTPLTTCKDGIFLGSCCHIPSHSEFNETLSEFPGNDLNTNPDSSTTSWNWTLTTTLNSTHSTPTTSSKPSFVTSIVTSIGIEEKVDNSTTMTNKISENSLSDHELINGVLDVMNSEMNVSQHFVTNSSWDATSANNSITTATHFSLITRKPMTTTSQSPENSTTSEVNIIDWAVITHTKEEPTTISTTPIVTTKTVHLKTKVTNRQRTTAKKKKPLTNRTKSTKSSQITTPTTVEFNLANADFRDACGRRFYGEDVRTARVEGGRKADFGKWPWQVSVRQWKKKSFQHKCGAALLNENWAISAAHCVANEAVEELQVRLGDLYIKDDRESLPHEDRQVQLIAKHPDFNPANFENDLALIRFYEPVYFRQNIVPICIPQDDNTFINDTAFITGWGRLYDDGPLPNQLREAEIPIISNLNCEEMYRKAGFAESIPDIFICAGRPTGGVDSCEGDSGGPLMIQGNDQRWFLAGIISWGIGCAEPNQPGVYTRISRFRDWINAILIF